MCSAVFNERKFFFFSFSFVRSSFLYSKVSGVSSSPTRPSPHRPPLPHLFNLSPLLSFHIALSSVGVGYEDQAVVLFRVGQQRVVPRVAALLDDNVLLLLLHKWLLLMLLLQKLQLVM